MYEVRLPVFQGPLDLLLHLIEKRQLDITTLSLVEVTEQYMEHVRSAEQIDMASLADFLVIGAKLLYIKSVGLLPRPVAAETLAEEDPGEELTRLLDQYRKFKSVAMELKTLDDAGLSAFPRLAPAPRPEFGPPPLELAFPELLVALEKVIERTSVEQLPLIERRKITVVERIGLLRSMLSTRPAVAFASFIADCASREALIVSLLSVLELIKTREVEVRQEVLFGEIMIYRA